MTIYPKTVLTSDPRVQGVPLGETNDPLVDVSKGGYPGLGIDERMGYLAGMERFLLRSEVVNLLVRAVELMPEGYRLALVEGYRSQEVQDSVYQGYLDQLRETHPDWGDEETKQVAARFASRPDMIAPHSTGGAADVLLIGPDGQELDMGSEINDTPESSDGRCYTDASLPEHAAKNRKIMTDALHEVGMVNYPSEWWHWSYGEQYWAWKVGAERTLYSPAKQEQEGA